MLITGGGGGIGQLAEIYHSDTPESPCVLNTEIPDLRWLHTQDGTLLCGGEDSTGSCQRWNADTGAWDLVTEEGLMYPVRLTEERWGHISWTPADGSVTYLMGGWRDPGYTSEMLEHDTNKVSTSFPMKYHTR